jgi:hypothetical protein
MLFTYTSSKPTYFNAFLITTTFLLSTYMDMQKHMLILKSLNNLPLSSLST